MNLQTAHDVSAVESEKGKAIEREVAADNRPACYEPRCLPIQSGNV